MEVSCIVAIPLLKFDFSQGNPVTLRPSIISMGIGEYNGNSPQCSQSPIVDDVYQSILCSFFIFAQWPMRWIK
jgi:hypothetical protein